MTLKMMEKNAALVLDLKEEVQQSSSNYGAVKKVIVYDVPLTRLPFIRSNNGAACCTRLSLGRNYIGLRHFVSYLLTLTTLFSSVLYNSDRSRL
ncbi:unnamed protein product [Cylicocyclus nassatus]|uniref:Uncharacterized protein n=1 Tax=Cylicocyclus nassatus TaxID=53992 RepID=A0AA36M6N2_CYLNA|nr:unnamed protein product [Cylicocyclus nassatus]